MRPRTAPSALSPRRPARLFAVHHRLLPSGQAPWRPLAPVFPPRADTAPVSTPRVHARGTPDLNPELATLNLPDAHGGLRANCATHAIVCPQPGHTGGGPGAGGTRAGARQSSSAPMRSRFALAAPPSHP